MHNVVIGASGGIGAALAAALEQRGEAVRRLSRRETGLDLADEASIAGAASDLGSEPIDRLIVATGMLHEGAAYTFRQRFVPAPTTVQWSDAIVEAQGYLHSLGITAWQDAWVEPDVLATYVAMAADGRLSARVSAALWWDRHRGMDQIANSSSNAARAPCPGWRPAR